MLAVSWRDVVLAVLPGATLAGGVSARAVDAAGELLGAPLPEDLAELLRETGGIIAGDGLAVVWPVERIVRENLELRAGAELDGDLLFFGGGADDGAGERYACVPTDPSRGIVAWRQRTGKRRTVATDLADYVIGVLAA
ncbi:SMI1/KNR4 family protein [Actinoplanes sp. NPDC051346]|uniref:SMI1/KNR4 family protein n=1 Tax=Actinoplanes sp. NPDC051346 TaxID=3155048 RepID=UPI003422A260